MKKSLVHIANMIFDTPLLIHRGKLDVILAVLGPRMNLDMQELHSVDMANGVNRRAISASPSAVSGGSGRCNLAILPVCGTLMNRTVGLDAYSGMTTYDAIGDQLDKLVADPMVDAIVMDFDSPGGRVAGCFDLAEKIAALDEQKPIYAVVNENAMSAAYLLASATRKIFMPPTALVGSIGVICTHIDMTGADAKAGLKYTYIVAGDYKAEGNPHQVLSEGAQGRIQEEVNEVYGLLTTAVANYRGMTAQEIVNTKAATYLGKSAVKAGLADEVMSATDAINAIAQEVMNMNDGNTRAAPAAAPAASGGNVPAPSATAPAPAPAPAVAPAILANADTRDYSAEAAEIFEACTLAEMPHLAAGFAREKLTPQQAKAKLFEAKHNGEVQTANVSATTPGAGGPVIGKDGKPVTEGEKLMVAAMTQLSMDPTKNGLKATPDVPLF